MYQQERQASGMTMTKSPNSGSLNRTDFFLLPVHRMHGSALGWQKMFQTERQASGSTTTKSPNPSEVWWGATGPLQMSLLAGLGGGVATWASTLEILSPGLMLVRRWVIFTVFRTGTIVVRCVNSRVPLTLYCQMLYMSVLTILQEWFKSGMMTVGCFACNSLTVRCFACKSLTVPCYCRAEIGFFSTAHCDARVSREDRLLPCRTLMGTQESDLLFVRLRHWRGRGRPSRQPPMSQAMASNLPISDGINKN